MPANIPKSGRTMGKEAKSASEEIEPADAIKLHGNPDIVLVDIRDPRELLAVLGRRGGPGGDLGEGDGAVTVGQAPRDRDIGERGIEAAQALDLEAVPSGLRVTYRAVDDGGRPLAWSKDLAALRRRLADPPGGIPPRHHVSEENYADNDPPPDKDGRPEDRVCPALE